jgi:hypothetical protein
VTLFLKLKKLGGMRCAATQNLSSEFKRSPSSYQEIDDPWFSRKNRRIHTSMSTEALLEAPAVSEPNPEEMNHASPPPDTSSEAISSDESKSIAPVEMAKDEKKAEKKAEKKRLKKEMKKRKGPPGRWPELSPWSS